MDRTEDQESREFVVVMRGPSAMRFAPDEVLRMPGVLSTTGPVNLAFLTRYVDEGYDANVPRDLWVEIRGSALSLREALQAFAKAAGAIAVVVAFSANAATGEPEIEVAYDVTPGITERDYFQQFLPEQRGMPRMTRRVNVDAAFALLRVLTSHPEGARLHRAISQYESALEHWRVGHETLALAHLYMGMEALTKAAIRDHCQTHQVTEPELAATLNLNWEELEQYKRQPLLAAAFRRIHLFQGDDECYQKAKDASDGFEHGFMGLQEVRTLASEVRDRTARYLREAVVNIAGVEGEFRSIMLDAPYDKPIGSWPLARYLFGRLAGEVEELAAKDQVYPIVRWEWRIKSFTRSQAGSYNVESDQQITPLIGEGVTFRPTRFEVWGPDSNASSQGDNKNQTMD
jgi:hypothetical protein